MGIEMIATETELSCFVFRTTLQNREEVERISGILNSLPGIVDWSVDLEDWEKVLRIECTGISSDKIIKVLREEGIYIEEMPV